MSGASFASAKWAPIPASPLGAAATGPVQSIDTRYLWWWTATEISCFDLQTFKWLGPWAWDGSNINCASQWYNGHVLFSLTSGQAAYRTLTQGGAGKYTDWWQFNDGDTISGNLKNTEFSGYLGANYAMNTGPFGYDPKYPEQVVMSCTCGYGPGTTTLIYVAIENLYLGRGVAGLQVGDGVGCSITPGGMMGNPGLLFGYYYADNINGLTISNLSISNFLAVSQPLLNDCILTPTLPTPRTYVFPLSSWIGGPLPINPAMPNFDAMLQALPAANPNGGWLGPNSLFLIESKTTKGNPSSFVYTETIRDLPNGAGQFGLPIFVAYNPLGDAATEFAGFKNTAFVGGPNSTNWYYLGLSSYNISKYNVTNYMFPRSN